MHEKVTKESESKKYFGDMVYKTGSINATIQNRKAKGQGIITWIMAILNDIPLGRHKMDIAMKLRKVMLIIGILYNSGMDSLKHM